MNTIKENYKLVIGVLVIGVALGWIFTRSAGEREPVSQTTEDHADHDQEAGNPSVYTCSMHPQIRQDEPGDCPICGMDLIPLATMDDEGADADPNEIMLSESAAKLADIQTSVVGKGVLEKAVFMQGKVVVDERRMAELTARYGGRIENLFVSFTGERVQKGERLATIYSPELVSAQQELIEAAAMKEERPALYNAAKAKLKLWDLTEAQIEEIIMQAVPALYFDVLAPVSGTVLERHVASGDYVKTGEPLFMLADLSKVWVMFDAYETDLPWISTGDRMEFTVQAIPGKTFEARVAFVDPVINARSRTAKVRVELDNPEMKLKPEMFASGQLYSRLATAPDVLLIPKSAVLWTGKRSVVYVRVPDRESPAFLHREIGLGPEAGDYYVVADGLSEGEVIATNGVFKIDAAAQLEGKMSMMNPEGGKRSTGHDHGGMEMDAGHTHFQVGGSCGMCKDRIEAAALSVDGVIAASWDDETMMLHLDHEMGTVIMKVHEAVARVGHDTELVKAPDAVYEALPGCCLYERL